MAPSGVHHFLLSLSGGQECCASTSTCLIKQINSGIVSLNLEVLHLGQVLSRLITLDSIYFLCICFRDRRGLAVSTFFVLTHVSVGRHKSVIIEVTVENLLASLVMFNLPYRLKVE